MRRLFLTPALDGPATGGTLYNRRLMAALDQLAVPYRQCGLEVPPQPLEADQVWVDSLYLRAVPELRRTLPARSRLGLLLHYLPSLLSRPELQDPAELSAIERAALASADSVVTPSAQLQRLIQRVQPDKPCVCVAPGVCVAEAELGGSAAREHAVIMVCNVTPNKRVLEFLRALAGMAGARDTCPLTVAGSLSLDPAYAARCLQLQAEQAFLRANVRFAGSLSQPELFAQLGRAAVCVCASLTESYGMALAEARALGTPLLAVPGGNIAQHVAADSGGALLPDLQTLAAALLALLRDPAELAARQRRARSSASARDWRLTAREFLHRTRGL